MVRKKFAYYNAYSFYIYNRIWVWVTTVFFTKHLLLWPSYKCYYIIIYISVMIINKYIPWIISKKKEQHDKN